jgi:hypothetical protein
MSSSGAVTTDLVVNGIQYATYVLEVCVCVSLIRGGRWRRLKGVGLYVASLFLLDGVARTAVRYCFGPASAQFFYFYWMTDVVIGLSAFLVICGFYWRACLKKEKLWGRARLLLILMLFVILAASTRSLIHYTHLYVTFVIGFSQNLYFACLVLNTLLYVMLQLFAIDDDELRLLVCGLGVQLAGVPACFALLHFTANNSLARVLAVSLAPCCTPGMLLVWLYTVAWRSGDVELPGIVQA